MIRKNLYLKLVTFLLICNISKVKAQVTLGGDAGYKVELTLKQNRGFSACDGEGGINLVRLDGATNTEIYNQANSGRFNSPGNSLQLEHQFTKTQTFNSVFINAESTRSGAFGSCRRTNFHENRINFSGTCVNQSGQLSFQHTNDFDYSLKVFPEVTIDQPSVNSYLADEFFLTISLPNTLNVSYYNWEYSITQPDGSGVNNFRRFPNSINGRITNNTATLRIKGKEFLNKEDFGKKINIRVKLGCNVRKESNVITLEYLRSAPLIKSITPNPSTVSCYDTNDGSIRITFERPLDSNRDNINIAVTDMSNQIGTTSLGQPIYAPVRQFNNISILDANNSILLTGLPPSKDGFLSQIELFTTGYYTGNSRHTGNIKIRRPEPVAFDITNKVDVWCYDGADGEIHLEASGGTNSGYEYTYRIKGSNNLDDWKPFENTNTHKIKKLAPEEYEVKVRDANYCIAKNQVLNTITGEIELTDELTRMETINKIETELSIIIEKINEPRAYGFKDGRILATIKGGTSYPDNTYDYEWRDADNNIILTTTEYFDADGNFQVMLHSIGKGDYKIIVKDANYDSATDNEGCTTTSNTFPLEEPEPIQVTIDIHSPISCHIENEYSDGIDFNTPLGIPDQFQDGALIATVIGGVQFGHTTAGTDECRSNFEPYCYRWKKQVGGVWVDIPTNDNIIYHQSVGTYALNVEDKNGIQLGTYEEYISTDGSREYRIVQATDSIKYLSQPDKLEISFTNTVVTCLNGNDGEATAIVTGGTPPYVYEWSNGQDTATINNLIGGTYLVFVTDAKGCRIEGSVKIEQPNGLEINPVSVIAPTCFEGDDGQIEVAITGGNPPYTFAWDTGSTSTMINGLSSGKYKIEVVDNKGCRAFFEQTLLDPDPIVVAMPEERSLCNGQSLLLDIAINDSGAKYSWTATNGFRSSDSAVEITKAGRYAATITSSLGCIGTGEIEVKVFDTKIDSDFLITTQAYNDQEVILVNVSKPIGETVEWTIPEGVEVISKNDEKLILKFDEAGPYDINLRSTQGDCYQDFTKTILVQQAIEAPEVFASQGEFIQEFIIYPNPNGGSFKTKVTLAEDANIILKIVNLMSGAIMNERSEKNKLDFLLDYTVSLPTGVYLMLLETPKGTETRKLVFE